MTTQSKSGSVDSNRRVCRSAAVIGLALSLGAYGLPADRQSDQAAAAEPQTGESANSDPSSLGEEVALQTGNQSQSSEGQVENSSQVEDSSTFLITHTVQEGQTLWDVARFYGTDASAIATKNNLSLKSVLHVGQVLIVPTDSRVASASLGLSDSAPGYYGPVTAQSTPPKVVVSLPATSPSVDPSLKARQDKSVEALREKREKLKSGLTKLTENTQVAIASNRELASSQPVANSSQTQEALPSVLSSLTPAKSSQAGSFDASSKVQELALRSSSNATKSDSVVQSLTSTYRVSPGETLSGIARKHGITVKQLIEANKVSDPNYIFANQVLTIPQEQNARKGAQSFNSEIAMVPSSTVTDVPVSVQTPAAVVQIPAAETKVAAVNAYPTTPQLNDNAPDTQLLRYNHIENLKQEIDKLRQKYQAQTERPQAVSVAAARSTTQAVFSETNSSATVSSSPSSNFNSDRLRQVVRDRIQSEQVPQARDVSKTVSSFKAQPQVVAAAPLGSESYDPIVQSRLGRAVSPELPSLGPGNEYLPGSPAQFAGYIWPTKGVLTSGYGWRWGRMHKGIDIAGPVGTPVVAAADGVVSYSGWNSGGYGNLVEITHPDGSVTLYAHNNRLLVQVGQQVSQGQQISEMGSTGYSTGPHLHFEVHPSGKGAMNPMAFLPRG